MEKTLYELAPATRDKMKATVGCPSEAAYPAIAESIRSYIVNEGAEYNQVEPITRELLADIQDGLLDLVRKLTLLNERPDFRRYNAAGNSDATSLTPHLEAMDAAEKFLQQQKGRLAKRSRKNWQRIKLRALFVELLEIRAKDLKIDAPTQMKPTVKSQPFHEYLELCLKIAEPNATEAERAEILKEGIALAIRSFQERKADPIYSWQWGDLFPQTESQLMKSRRFLNA